MKRALTLSILLLSVVFAKAQNKKQDTIVYSSVETSAAYPGGIEKFYQYLGNHVKYSKLSNNDQIKTKLVIRFIIEKDGGLSNFTIIKSISPVIDSGAIQVIKSAGKWMPGKQGNKNVRQYYFVPITIDTFEH